MQVAANLLPVEESLCDSIDPNDITRKLCEAKQEGEELLCFNTYDIKDRNRTLYRDVRMAVRVKGKEATTWSKQGKEAMTDFRVRGCDGTIRVWSSDAWNSDALLYALVPKESKLAKCVAKLPTKTDEQRYSSSPPHRCPNGQPFTPSKGPMLCDGCATWKDGGHACHCEDPILGGRRVCCNVCKSCYTERYLNMDYGCAFLSADQVENRKDAQCVLHTICNLHQKQMTPEEMEEKGFFVKKDTGYFEKPDAIFRDLMNDGEIMVYLNVKHIHPEWCDQVRIGMLSIRAGSLRHLTALIRDVDCLFRVYDNDSDERKRGVCSYVDLSHALKELKDKDSTLCAAVRKDSELAMLFKTQLLNNDNDTCYKTRSKRQGADRHGRQTKQSRNDP